MKNKIPRLRFPEFSGEWEIIRMKEIFPKIRNGFVGIATPFYIESGIKYLQGKNIKNGKIDPSGLINIIEEFHIKKVNSQLYTNDILMVQSGHIGECAKVTKNYENSNCHALLILTPTQKVNSDFFVNYFYSPKGKKHIYKIKTGNTIEHILSSDVKELEVKKPSLPEQEKIANFLSSVDIKIEKLEKKKELLEKYKKGMMQKLFSQKLRFKDENGNDYPGWKENLISDLFKVSAGGDIKSENISEVKTDEFRFPVYANSDKNKGLFGYSNIYKQESGCITVTGRGNLGRATARYDKFYPIVRLLVLRPQEKQNIKFFEEAINNTTFFIESTGVPQLTGPQISIYPLKYPSFPEQEKIANFLSSIDRKIELIEEELEKNKEFKKGLLQQMFV